MPPAPGSAFPLRPQRRRPARAPAVVAVVALLGLGGAVAGGYSTGLALGTRIARPGDDPRAGLPNPGEVDPPSEPEGDDGVTGPAASERAASPPPSAPPASVPEVRGPATTTTTTSRSTTAVPDPADPRPGSDPTAPSVVPDQSVPRPRPVDPIEATRQLVGAAAGGDVDRVWDMLTPSARAAIGDRRSLASRLTDLHDRLAPMRGDAPLATTALATPRGVVTVVAPFVDPGRAPIVLPFVDVDGRPRLAAIDPPPGVRWVAPSGDEPDLVVGGAHRPSRVAVDGVAASGVPDEPDALRVPVATVTGGSHRAVAVFVDGRQVTASAFEFTTPARPVDPGAPPVPAPDGTPAVAPVVPTSSEPAP